MNRLPSITSKDMLRTLQKAGFYIHHQTGSHVILRHAASPRRVTVPFHNMDLHRGIVKSILHQAGISEEQFAQLL